MNEQISINKSGNVKLNLPDQSYKKSRTIGKVQSGIFYTERTSSKHLLRINQSLGFNHKLINECGKFSFVCVNYDFHKIWTSKVSILKYGGFFKFGKGALELQIFMPLRYFKESKADAEEELRSLSIQYNIKDDTESLRANNEINRVKYLQTKLFA